MKEFSKITVLTLEQATVAPYLTYRMAMDGMEVLRLEHPVHGDPNRKIGENVLGENLMSSYYLCINAGKKSITLDLSKSKSKDILKKVISGIEVDIFITNQLPKNYKKLGISYDALKSIKKDIIWVGITGFGPDSNEPAYDPILQARSGLMDLTGDLEGDPQVLGIPLPDMGTSEHAYGLIMKALYKRAVTGKGSQINLSMFESSVSWLTVPITMASSFNINLTRHGNTHKFFCPVSVYKTNDGYIYIAVGNNRQWDKLVNTEIFNFLNKNEYKKNSGRIKNVRVINANIQKITKQHTSSNLLELFKTLSIPASEIKSVSDVVKDPIIKNKLLYATDPKTKKQITLAPAPNRTEFLIKNNNKISFPPRFGENNEEIFIKVGYSQKEINQFRENGYI